MFTMLTLFTTVKGYRRMTSELSPRPAGRRPITRRERVRDATTAEIKTTARSLLVESGPEALTLRAIAREMGLSAPALYRYFASHEDLVDGLCDDVLAEITAELERARDSVDSSDPGGRLMAACRAFRRWSLDHPREFHLTFASGVKHDPAGFGGREHNIAFGAVFLGIFVEIWSRSPFPVPDEAALPPALTAQVKAFADRAGSTLPIGVLVAYLSGWVRLYGAVTIEVFGHLGFALHDAEPMFEAMLAEMRRQLTAPVP